MWVGITQSTEGLNRTKGGGHLGSEPLCLSELDGHGNDFPFFLSQANAYSIVKIRVTVFPGGDMGCVPNLPRLSLLG